MSIGSGRKRRPFHAPRRPTVHCWWMSRTNIDLDDAACDAVMRRYQLGTKREAVNFALRTVAAERLLPVDYQALRAELDEIIDPRLP